MKVAIDSAPLESGHKVRGIGVHTYELIKALRKLKEDNLRIDLVDFAKANLSEYDLVHYQYFSPFSSSLPTNMPAKSVVTIHDLIQLVYPSKYKAGLRGKINFSKQKTWARKVDAVITISETSKKDIVRFLGVCPSKIHVVYLAPRKAFRKTKPDIALQRKIAKKYDLPSKFVLYVGDINYNKNIPGLIKACKLAKLPLVISGKSALNLGTEKPNITLPLGPRDWLRGLLGRPHPELAHYKRLFDEFQDNSNVIRLGFVPSKDLAVVCQLASVYCQPSFYEGFGLPVLEAFASGAPCVIAKTNALVEVADGAALIADPRSPKDMAKKITRVLKGKKTKKLLVEKGLERASQFSWKKTARETLEVYEKLR
jgi:glycosyltransferase involved in cell wall biosynthesis